jgi:hypothetical protein
MSLQCFDLNRWEGGRVGRYVLYGRPQSIIPSNLGSSKNYKNYRQSGWLCTRWGEIAQSLNFKYLYKSHCKSNELLWAFKGYPIIQSPQQFAGFAVTLVKIFKV